MEAETRRRLASSFEDGADVYAAHRPTYPSACVDWLVGARPADVLDLGAGTGALTGLMTARGHRVIAAELSWSMLQALVSGIPAVPAVQSGAELLPFEPGSFDIVTVATAFHWFDAPRALAQVHSVLRPGGRLALVWNTRLEAGGWQDRLGELLRAAQPEALRGRWCTDAVSHVIESPMFGNLEQAEFPFTQPLDRDGLISLMASRSYVQALDPDRRRALLDDVGHVFDEVATTDPGGVWPQVELPYAAQCWRATTRADTDS